jgi:predicted ArsR family transcriptional regulator
MADSTVERIDKEYPEATSEARATRKAKPEATKRAQLIRMLRAPTGVGVAAICSKLGWQAHTTRAALSRLRTAGFEIKREQSSNGGPARYRLVSAPGREWRSDGR